jgi:Peptidase S24-like
MTRDRWRAKVEGRQRQRESLASDRLANHTTSQTAKIPIVGSNDRGERLRQGGSRALGRGRIVGVVWAGDPEIQDVVLDEGSTDSLLDELAGGPEDYFLRVRGLSLRDAGIEDGDLIRIRALRPGDWPSDGQIVHAEVDIAEAIGEQTGRTTLKRFYREDKDHVRLEPANESYAPLVYGTDDIRILGIVMEGIRRFSPR